MEVKPLRTIGGLTITMFDENRSAPNGLVTMQIPREVLSLLAVQCIQEIGPDASEDLILVCRGVVNAADKAEEKDPVWTSDLFTDQERDAMVELQIDELRECVKDYAYDELNKLEVVDCLALIDNDSEETCRYLQMIGMDSTYAEAARNHDEDNESGAVLDFCKRFKLITEDETNITDLGAKYIANFGNPDLP